MDTHSQKIQDLFTECSTIREFQKIVFPVINKKFAHPAAIIIEKAIDEQRHKSFDNYAIFRSAMYKKLKIGRKLKKKIAKEISAKEDLDYEEVYDTIDWNIDSRNYLSLPRLIEILKEKNKNNYDEDEFINMLNNEKIGVRF